MNHKPKARPDAVSFGDTAGTYGYTYRVTGNDTDPDSGDHLRVVATSVTSVSGAKFLDPSLVHVTRVALGNPSASAKDSLQVTLDPAFQGLADGQKAVIVIGYTIADDHGAKASSTLTVTVNGMSVSNIFGTANSDKHLWGEPDADSIFGNGGNDVIHPRGGHDEITGGPGKDLFVFSTKADSSPGDRDEIKDFTRGEDRIDLSGFAGKFGFSGTASHFDGGHDIRYAVHQDGRGKYLTVLVDSDGDKHTDLAIDVHGASSLSRGDFIL